MGGTPEILEATSVLIHLSRHGADYSCFAPNTSFAVYNHATGNPQQLLLLGKQFDSFRSALKMNKQRRSETLLRKPLALGSKASKKNLSTKELNALPSRGQIRDLEQLVATEFDAVIFPGGFVHHFTAG